MAAEHCRTLRRGGALEAPGSVQESRAGKSTESETGSRLVVVRGAGGAGEWLPMGTRSPSGGMKLFWSQIEVPVEQRSECIDVAELYSLEWLKW